MSKQLKQIFSLFVSVVMIFSMFAGINFSVSAEDDILDYLTWKINNGEVTITDCDESISGDIVIPDTIEGYPVTVIGDNAFYNTGIVNIIISENIVNIGTHAFYECTSFESITVDENNENYSNDEYGVLFNKDKTELIQYPLGNSRTSYNIPDSVTIIGDSSFFHCMNLSSVTIPDSVIIIRADAFGYCTKLESVKIGNGLTTIELGAFALCSFESIDLPDSVRIISDAAFAYCYFLESITIPEGVERIEPSTFVGCLSLKEINFPDSLKHIDCAFDVCPTIESFSIPANVTTTDKFGSFSTSGRLKEIFIYNPTFEMSNSSIGYVGWKFVGDYDEFKERLKEAKVVYLSNEENAEEAVYELFDYFVSLDELEKIENFNIHGYKGSTAEAYANEHGFKFVPICDHVNTEIINFAGADCKNNGYTGDVYCNDCEEIISYGETVPATDHDYIENIIKEPTFTQPGIKNDVCENCGDATAEVEIPQLTIEDSEEKENTDTDISIIYPDGTFDGEIEVEVTPVEEGEAYKLISHKEGNYKVTMFDINVTVDGEKVQPNGTVLVKIPLPNGYNPNKCAVYYVSDDGTMEELTTYHYKDGYIYFETDHFSYYAILESVENTDVEEDNTETSMSFFDKIIAFFKKIIEFIKNLFA